MNRLHGKRAIVTGGASGIGAAIVRLFVAHGARVCLTDIATDAGQALARELGDNARFLALDVTEETAWQSATPQAVSMLGGLDILVNNAGIMEPGSAEGVTADVHHRTMRVHVDGTLWGCKHAIPAMAQSGGGSIVNMASIASLRGAGHVVSYCAAKGAVEALTRAVSDHCALKRNGVRCNSIHPAGIITPMVQDFFEQLGAEEDSSGGYELGKPEDVAEAAVYLASDESRRMSGQRLVLDNGISHMPGLLID